MGVKKALLITGLLAIPAAAGFAYYKHVENQLSVDFDTMHINGIADGLLSVTLNIKITNGTGVPFTINSCDTNIYLNNNFLGVAKMIQPLQVPGHGVNMLQIDASFNADKMGDAALNYIGSIIGGKKDLNFLIQGLCRFNVNMALLQPFSMSVKIDETYAV